MRRFYWNGKTTILEPPHGYSNGQEYDTDIFPTLTTGTSQQWKTVLKEPQLIQLAQLQDSKYNDMSGRVYDIKGLSPTVRTCQGGNLEPKIIEPFALDEQNQYIRADGIVGTLTCDVSSPKHNNRVIEPLLVGGIGDINFGSQYRQGNRVYDSEEIACALQAGPVGNAGGNSYLYLVDMSTKIAEPRIFDMYNQNEIKNGICGTLTSNGNTSSTHCGTFGVMENNYRIRKLTPKECWRDNGCHTSIIGVLYESKRNYWM